MTGFAPLGSVPIAALGSGGSLEPIVLTDALGLVLTQTAIERIYLRTGVLLGDGFNASAELVVTMRDALALEDVLASVLHELLGDALGLGLVGADFHKAIAQLEDRLVLSGAVSSYTEAGALIVDALAFGELLEAFPHNGLTDAVGLAEQAQVASIAAAQLVDALRMADAMTDSLTLTVLLRDGVTLDLAQATSAEVHEILRDSLGFALRLSLNDEQYIAWSMNTDSKAASTYANWPFNSHFKVGATRFGVSDVGLFALGGTDDAGEPIAARLRFGLNVLGSRVLKRIPAVYFGFRGDDFYLKVITTDNVDGARTAHLYRCYARGATTLRELRRKTGRGLKGVYLDLEIENADGGALDFDTIDFAPLYLERRTRGNAGGKP